MTEQTAPSLMITGAASGIGLAMARAGARSGHRLALFDIDAQVLGGVVEELRTLTTVQGFVVDVTRYDQVEQASLEAVAVFGSIDKCLNNAGIGAPLLPLPDLTSDQFERVLRVNAMGAFHVLKAVLGHMRERGRGAVVNTGSILGERGTANYAAYVASKHAVHGLTRAAAVEAAAYGVRVNAVAPGLVDTPMNDAFHSAVNEADPAAAQATLAAKIPLGRYADPDHIAQAALFLLSDAAAYITGEIVDVDGGLSTAF
jgi:NAD(P)-dependent dehydrogenase (short-subunit alcohol dehydrogenase family)